MGGAAGQRNAVADRSVRPHRFRRESTSRAPRWSAGPGPSTGRWPRPIPTRTSNSTSRTPLELLVATILSAQSTDKRVNLVTPAVFARYPRRGRVRRRGPGRARGDDQADRLLPGQDRHLDQAGRRARGAVRRRGAGHPGRAGHAARRRSQDGERRAGQRVSACPASPSTPTSAGWSGGSAGPPRPTRSRSRPRSATLFPPRDWTQLCHHVIWHGRRRCHARNPACGACPVARWCPAFGEGETDPVKAAKLVREPRG